MSEINWLEMISIVCARGGEALKWDLPEAWFHTELFGAFSAIAPLSGWEPFDFEVPYRTFYPVEKANGNDWKTVGAEKWVDLCLHSDFDNQWCWFELKVRHLRADPVRRKFAQDAQAAFCRDTVALIGFSTEATYGVWRDFDRRTEAYKEKIAKHAEALRSGKHRCVTAFVQLSNGESQDARLDPTLWDTQTLLDSINKMLADKSQASGCQRALPEIVPKKLERAGYSIVVCEWSHIENS